MAMVTSKPYTLAPGNTTEGTLQFPEADGNIQITIEIGANGFQFNTLGAVGSTPALTSDLYPKVIISVNQGESLAYKANNSAASALISW
jgi:hypothetical protein